MPQEAAVVVALTLRETHLAVMVATRVGRQQVMAVAVVVVLLELRMGNLAKMGKAAAVEVAVVLRISSMAVAEVPA